MNREKVVKKPRQNQVLVAAMGRHGFKQADAALFVGVSITTFGRWLNEESFPNSKNNIEKLVEFSGCTTLDEIFPKLADRKLKEIIDVDPDTDREYLKKVGGGLIPIPPTMEEIGEEIDLNLGFLKEALDKVLGSLSKREEEVLRLRFLEEKSLEECAPIIGVTTRERVRQIETAALMKLRHPSKRVQLIGFWE